MGEPDSPASPAAALSLLQATLESTADGLLVVSRDGRVLSHNQKFLQMWGLPPALVAPEADVAQRFEHLAQQTVDPEGFKARVLELFDRTPEAAVHDQILLKDGRVFERYSQPQRLDDQIVGRIWSYRDVTRQQQALAALEQREADYRLVVETANSVILRWDIDGTVRFINDYGQRFFGFRAEEMVGRPITETIVPGTESTGRDLAQLMERICRQPDAYIFNENENRFNENENRCKDGRRVWVAWANRAVVNSAGERVGVLSVGADVTERRQLEEHLRQSQQFLHDIVENIPLAVFTKDIRAGFRYELINPHCQRVLGFSRDSGLGKNDFDLLPAELAEHHQRQDLAVIAGGEPVETFEQLHRCGSTTYVRSVKLLLRDSQGQPTHLLGIGEDITERRRQETALRQSEERFRTLIENVPGAVYRCLDNERWTMTFLSDAIATLTGYPPSDFTQGERSFAELLQPEDAKAVAATIHQAVVQQRPYLVEYPITHADGGERWLYEKGQGVFDDQGNLLWLDGVILDITDRKRGELLQARQQQVLELIATDAPLETTLTEIVSAFEALARCSAGSILFLDETGHLHHSIAPHLPVAYQAAVDGLAIGPAAGSCGTAAYRKAPVIVSDTFSDPLWAIARDLAHQFQLRSCWSMPIVSSQNQVLGTFALYFDRPHQPRDDDWQILETAAHLAGIAMERQRTAQELYRAKEAAEAASRAKSQFLANMSHELRTPMNAILGFAQLLERDPALSPHQQQALEVINTSGEQLLELINDVLAMAKIEAGRVTVERQSFHLHGLLQELHHQFLPLAQAQGLQLQLTLAAAVPDCAVGDADKLQQVLANLLSNAVKFTERGYVALTVEPAGEQLRFAIADTGPGIAPELLPRLFQPFVQAPHQVPGEGGSGLGLAITQQFVQLMGGTLAVDSQPGQGTTFTCTLPLSPAPSPCEEPAGAERGSRSLRKVAEQQVRLRLSETPSLEALPRGWVQECHQAAIQADTDWLESLMGELSSEQESLAAHLNHLITELDFETLIDLTEPPTETAGD